MHNIQDPIHIETKVYTMSSTENLKNILLLARSIAKNEFDFTQTEKRIYKEFLLALGLEESGHDSYEDDSAIREALEKIKSREEKTLLMDILLLTVLSQGNINDAHKLLLYKTMRRVNLESSEYLVFPWNISFDEFLHRKETNLDNLYRLLWTKVAHELRKKIFIPQWSESLSCFVSIIDKQHKAMIDHFANYVIKLQMNQSVSEVKKMLGFLQNYAQEHFKTEETLMLKMSYPFTKDHQKAHEAFRQKFSESVGMFKKEKNLRKLQEDISSMQEWFLDHVREKDVRAGFFFKIQQASSIRKNQVLIYALNGASQDNIKKELASFGFEKVTVCDNEKESWDWIQTGDIAVLLIVDDGAIFKGVDLLNRIRKNANDSPVILIPTKRNHADLLAGIKQQRLTHPRNYVLPHPYSIDSLVKKLNTAIFKRK